jgi:hypothetical protein
MILYTVKRKSDGLYCLYDTTKSSRVRWVQRDEANFYHDFEAAASLGMLSFGWEFEAQNLFTVEEWNLASPTTIRVTTVYGAWKYGLYIDGHLKAVIYDEGSAVYNAVATLAQAGLLTHDSLDQMGDSFPELLEDVISTCKQN